ncbi:terminase small subunit [Variovorax paradoxus]|uniref:terminase small subunit n=1 Tax=Variovorax paradoxus TaxID=34073 RepID=UPI0004849FE5
MFGLDRTVTQAEFGELVDVSQQAVSDLMARNVIVPGRTAQEWLVAYVKHLRDQAAGRGADGVLAFERARYAREQADAQAMKNAVARKEFAPVFVIEEVLAKIGRQVASTLEAIPVALRRRFPELTGPQLIAIEEEIVKARNIAAGATMDAIAGDEDANGDVD